MPRTRCPRRRYDIYYYLPGDTIRTQRIVMRRDELLWLSYSDSTTSYLGGYVELLPISHAPPPPPERWFSISTEGRKVSGTIIDPIGGDPLIGASVLIKGTTLGTVTDMDGRFTLRVPAGSSEIEVTYTGYSSKTVYVGLDRSGAALGQIEMESNTELLEEVVVTGYSVAMKRDMTGSVIIRGANLALAGRSAGVVVTVEPTNPEVPLSPSSLPVVAARSDFADLAGYHPRLTTNGRGEVTFQLTYPDDITAWTTYAVGQDRRRRIGFAQLRSQSFLPFQAQLYLPRFLVQGDRGTATGLAINRTGVASRSRLSFSGDGAQVQSAEQLLAESQTNHYDLGAPYSLDSLTYRFTVQETKAGGEADGEERKVPVYPRGTEMVAGRFLVLKDSAVTITREDLDERGGNVTLQLFGNRLEQLTNELDYIIDYPYTCAEQTASRLIGLLAKQRIERARGLTVDHQHAIIKSIARLRDLQRGRRWLRVVEGR